MRHSSHNHKVSTVHQNQGDTQFPTRENPFGSEDLSFFDPNFSGSDSGQLTSRSQEYTDEGHRPPPPRSLPPQPYEISDLETDYWQQTSSEINLSYGEPPHQESAEYDGERDQIFEDESFVDVENDPFEADLWADDFALGPGERPPPHPKQSRAADHEENLDYLFGEATHTWKDRAQSKNSQPKNSQSKNSQSRSNCGNVDRSKSSIQRHGKTPLKHKFEKEGVKAVMAASSADYFILISQMLGRACSSLSQDSARSPSILRHQLITLQLLAKRYGTYGLEEKLLLDDAVELYTSRHERSHSAELLPVLTGLAIRVLLIPHLDQGLLNPPLIQRLSSAIGESVKLLAIRCQLKALPGLVAHFNRLSVEDRDGLNQLPQRFDQAVVRITQAPRLYQRLCRYAEGPSTVSSPPEAPQRLRFNGPIEISFRQLGG